MGRSSKSVMKRKINILLLLIGMMTNLTMNAQVFEVADSCRMTDGKATEDVVVADGFWRNWFVQFGLDMTLQN